MRRVLLVNMPMAEPKLPNLGMEILAAELRRAGQSCDVLYGSLLMPPRIGRKLTHSMCGQAVFVPAMFGIDSVVVAEAVAAIWNPAALTVPKDPLAARESRVVDLLIGMDAAEECLDACLAAIRPGNFDVVAFSLLFDGQKLPSICLATRLKQRDGIAVLFGGSACDGGMGRALMERFAVIDAVVEGDAEDSIPMAVAALRGEASRELVPNAYWRSGDSIVATPRRDTRRHLDAVLRPDYDAYLRQKAASAYADKERILMFEASRGCWWGVKHHCTFCGLRSDGLAYRERDADLVLEEVRRLHELYAPSLIYATDGILGRNTLQHAMPAIARWRRANRQPVSLFFEIKSSLKAEEAALLACAGVVEVQPGIESFSTEHLRLMRKGATALQQVECLKWLAAYGISVVYAIMVGVPGEQPDDYVAALSLMRRIHHLPPPVQVNFIVLDQFSPYSSNPEHYGIFGVRPLPVHPILYQTDDSAWLLRATYERSYDHASHTNSALARLRLQVGRELLTWTRAFQRGEQLLSWDDGTTITIFRTSADGFSFEKHRGLEAALLRQGRNIAGEAAAAQGLDVPEDTVSTTLHALEIAGLVAREDNRFLALPAPLGVDCWRDSGIEPPPSVRPETLAEI